MVYNRKELWKDIQLYVKSSGLIIKKMPVTLLKQVDQLQQTGQGSHVMKAMLESFQFSGTEALCQHFAQGDLSTYCKEVMANDMWSKNANVYLAFQVASGDRTVKPLSLVGVLATGTFNANRYEGDTDFAVEVDGAGNSAAELELVLAAPGKGIGRPLTLWGIGDLMMRSSQGQSRYKRLVALTGNNNMAKILTDYGFHQTASRERLADGSVQAADPAYVLPNTNTSPAAIRERMKLERPGLFDVCGFRDMRLWQNCR